jgi:hypothetical protein
VAPNTNSPTILSSNNGGAVINGNTNNGTYFTAELQNSNVQGNSVIFSLTGANSWVKVNGSHNLSNRAYAVNVSNTYARGTGTTGFTLLSSFNDANNTKIYGCTVEGYLHPGGRLNGTQGTAAAIKWIDA